MTTLRLLMISFFLTSCVSKRLLPNHLKFGQNERTAVKRLERNSNAKRSGSESGIADDSALLTYIQYNKDIILKKQLTFHYKLLFLRQKLIALQIQYYVPQEFDHSTLYNSLCHKFGKSVTLSGSIDRSWACYWEVGDKMITYTIERIKDGGKVIVLNFTDIVANKEEREIMEKELDKAGATMDQRNF